MSTIQMVPPEPGGPTKESIERFMAGKGVKVEWKVPQPSPSAANALDLSAYPEMECPGCLRLVKRHDHRWRRARLEDGRLGRFMFYCRSCEDLQAGYSCAECGLHRRQSLFRVTGKGKDGRTCRTRICVKCEAKPAEERPRVCSKCGTKVTRAEAPKGWCKACVKTAGWKPKPKPRVCLGCAQERPRDDFPVAPSGRARRYCNGCVQAAEARTEKECFGCHAVKPMGEFPGMVKSVDGRRGICGDCYRKVSAHKMRKVRKRARIAP